MIIGDNLEFIIMILSI